MTALGHRVATIADVAVLGQLNLELIEDEWHRTKMIVAELESRMKAMTEGDYRAPLFERNGQVIAYAL